MMNFPKFKSCFYSRYTLQNKFPWALQTELLLNKTFPLLQKCTVIHYGHNDQMQFLTRKFFFLSTVHLVTGEGSQC